MLSVKGRRVREEVEKDTVVRQGSVESVGSLESLGRKE
jgi:hypothetical protein